MSDYRPLAVVRAPIATRSGYGAMSRDIVYHLIEKDEYDVIIHSINWGVTPMNALKKDNERDRILLDRIEPEQQLNRKPDLYISISIPTEFRPIGQYNIGITAGIETTQVPHTWIQHVNVMDVTFTISEHSKKVFLNSKYAAQNQQGQQIGTLEVEKPIEVLHNCIDTDVFKKLNDYELDKEIRAVLDDIPDPYNFLFVGNWMQGNVGEDRKNVGLLVKLFFEVFKRQGIQQKPGLILKTSQATASLLDRERIKKRIDQIKESVELDNGEELPNVYLMHGDLTDEEMNSLYNHSKVKTHISLTHGEGFGRPLLEASITGKPIIAPGFSGQLDFLNPENCILIGGELVNIPESVQNDWFIKEAQWLNVDPNMAATAMLEAYHNYSQWKEKASDLRIKNRREFRYEKIRQDFWDLLDKYVPTFEEPPTQMPQMKQANLPSLKKNIKKGSTEPSLPKMKKLNTPQDSEKVTEPNLPKMKKL